LKLGSKHPEAWAAWTSDEDAAIRAGVEAGRPWKEISEGLPGREFFATKTRGEVLGLKHWEVDVPWTADEDARLRAGVEAGESWKEISDGLPGRTDLATKHRGIVLGLQHGEARVPWTADEDARLRAGVEAGESWSRIVEELPGRGARAAELRAMRLKIERSEILVIPWTEAEDGELRAGVAGGKTNEEIAARLPDRTPLAVKARRFALRGSLKEQGESVRRLWTKAEDAALRESFASGKRWKEIAKAFPGRTQNAVERRGRRQLKLKRGDSGSAV
jgi:hypothetical protein